VNYVEEIERLSAEMVRDADRDLGAAVMACPGWSVRDLIDHVSSVQRFWTVVVRDRITDRARIEQPAPRPDAVDPLDWSSDATAGLVSALNQCPIDTPLWTWWGPEQSARFVRRRQLNEVAMHAYDARHAVGDPRPLRPEIAVVGLDEFVSIMSQDTIEGSTPTPLRVTATDVDWSATLFESTEPTAHVSELSGTASDLLLSLWSRKNVADPVIAATLACIDRS
jgi:uncharacterized protein (TIGR03083 family)